MLKRDGLKIKYGVQTYNVRPLAICQVHITVNHTDSAVKVEYEGDRVEKAFILPNFGPFNYDERLVSDMVDAIMQAGQPYRAARK